MPKMPSAESSTKPVQSKLNSAVNKTRNALAQAKAKQQAHPDDETARAATEAFRAYRGAVDARCDEINARFIELANLHKQGGNTNEEEAELAALEKEFRELKNSVIENYQIQPETLGVKKPPVQLSAFGQFCSASAITINAAGNATPYPSNISVSGPTGLITGVTVTLNNLSHASPDDIDMLLVGPGGQNAIIMSDVGGFAAASNVTLTLDDAAASNLPDSGPLVTGTFKPTNAGGVDAFPGAPAPSGGSALSVFNSTNPNGTWNLYIRDDTGGLAGSLAGGWCLNITTEDVTPCTLTCPSDVIQAATAGNCGAVVNYPAPTTSGSCGAVTCSPASGSFFPIGTTPVNCSSASGSTCSFNVTVTGTCPGGCNPTSITINAAGAASPYPSSLAISGLTGVVSTVTVTLNNFSHTFPDDVDILLVGPGGQNAIIMSDVGGTSPVSGVTLTLDDAAASNLPDAGPLVTGTFKPTDNGVGAEIFPAPAPAPSGGSALSVFNSTNPNGTWHLYIKDDTAGEAGSFAGGWCLNITTVSNCMITCPANQTVSNDPNQCGAVVTYPAPTTTGSCGTVNCSPASGSFFPTGTTTVTCTTQSGPSCSFTVTVNDTQDPSITCPTNVTQANDPDQCGAVVNYPAPTVSDNCPGVGTPVCDHASGSFFPKGTMTVNCTVSDAAGNDASCSFTVTVNDTQAPTITCPANVTQSTAPNQCQAAVSYPAPTASDNCPGVGTPVCDPASGSFFPKGTTTVNCTVTDASGNSASCSFTVTVNDTQAPTVTCPANITTTTGLGQCSRMVTFTVTASDNCPGVTVVSSPPSGTVFPKGTTTVTATATDASGNTAMCSFTVTVLDMQLPFITCPPNQTVSVPIGQPCGIVNYPAPTASDNCPGVAVVCNPPSGSCFPNGTTTVTCTATDTSGNTASCSFTVSTFDICLQDDDDPSVVLRFNSVTGDYIFCCHGTVYTGNGTVTIKPNQIRLEDQTAIIKLDAKVQTQANKGSASLQPLHGPPLCDIKDKNLSNNTCACP
jgi:subtilisin-like proprotein convertase family protein